MQIVWRAILPIALLACGDAQTTPVGTPDAGDACACGDTGSPPGTRPDGADSALPSGSKSMLELLKAKDPKNYATAIADGVQFSPTSDGRSVYAYYTPPGFRPNEDGFIVSLHGHDGFASTSYTVWKPFIDTKKYGLIAIQWWFGGGETSNDYYAPADMYPVMRRAVSERGIASGKILFEGFSRASANSYPIAAMDRADPNPLFLLFVANAGRAVSNYPPVAEIDSGKYGAAPFDKTHWVLFCGGQDPEPDQSGCPGMTATQSWLKGYGASVDLFIQDPNAGHGGFHQNPQNAESALAVYEGLRTK